jgi:hypothetical protein
VNVEDAIAAWVKAIRAQESTRDLLQEWGLPPEILVNLQTTHSSKDWKWAWDYRQWVT